MIFFCFLFSSRLFFVSQIPTHFVSFFLNAQNCFNSPFQILSHMAEITRTVSDLTE
jgi:hypothetical protein